MQEIERGIFVEQSYPGVTLGAITHAQGTILVDAPLRTEDARSWLSIVVNISRSPHRILANLDAHIDRTLGARSMDCTVLAHQDAVQAFRGRQAIFKGQHAETGSEWEAYEDVIGTRWLTPGVAFDKRIWLHWGPDEVIFEYRAGPAPGAIWVAVPSSGVVFIGDAVVVNQPPFLAHADILAWIETLTILQKSYRKYVIVSARSGIVTMDDVRVQKRHLNSIRLALERLEKRRAPLEAVDSLILRFLSKFDYAPELKEQYIQRYHHGLRGYYARHFHPGKSSGK